MSDERRLLSARCCRLQVFRHMVRKSSTFFGRARRAARARTKQTQGQPPENAMPNLWQGWSLEARTAGTTRELQAPRTRARAKAQERWQHAAAGTQGQEECEALEVQRPGTRRQGLPEEEAELVGCGESVSPPSSGETTLRGFFLTALEEPHQRVRHVCGDIVSSLTSTTTRGPESRREQADWREDLLQVAGPRVGARSQNHPESGKRGQPNLNARAGCRGVVSFRGAGLFAVSPTESRAGSGAVHDDRARGSGRHGRGDWQRGAHRP